MQSPEELQKLVSQAKLGDSTAFSALYEYYLTPIFRFIYFRVKTTEDAEDLTQHVFIKAWAALGDFEQEGTSFSAWLYRIARNTTIDYWRKKKPLSIDPASPVLLAKEDPGNNPEQLAQQGQDATLIRQALCVLGEDQQTVLQLRFIEGFSNAEIAHILGKSEGAVRQAQSRGLKVLRQYFKDNNVPL